MTGQHLRALRLIQVHLLKPLQFASILPQIKSLGDYFLVEQMELKS